jgi:hypothetical protein
MKSTVCILLFVSCGCGARHVSEPVASAPAPCFGETIEFDGKVWTKTPAIARIGLLWEGLVYQGDSADVRLVEAKPLIDANVQLIRQTQRKSAAGTWVQDGLEETIDQFGNRALTPYRNDKLDGQRLVYYKTGQLEIRDNYKAGKEHGSAEGWYENGQLKYRSVYSAGVELEGQAFDEDGKPLGQP